MKQTTYADSGVRRDLGDTASSLLYKAARETWESRNGKLGEVIVPFDDFSGVRAIDVSGLPKGTLMNIGFDGVGTKIELAERMNNHSTVAYDLVAMVCDDAVVRGAEPVLVGSILDVRSLGTAEKDYLDRVEQLAGGYVAVAKDANVAVINGEVAELGNRVGGYGSGSFIDHLAHHYISVNLRESNWNSIKLLSSYLVEEDINRRNELLNEMDEPEKNFICETEKMKSFNYNWGAAVVWFAKKERLFTGKEIQAGDYLVGLREEGFRSNGLSLVKKIMEHHHNKDHWHNIMWKKGNVTLGELALTPSRIYTKAVVEMFGGYSGEPKTEIHGVAHITGGGIPEKLGRVLKPSELGAAITTPYEPSEFMQYTQALGGVSDVEAYRTWNMGQGMIVITPRPLEVIAIAHHHTLEAQIIGQITSEQCISIQNQGVFAPHKNPQYGMYPQGERLLHYE